jgi:hypothetical protein
VLRPTAIRPKKSILARIADAIDAPDAKAHRHDWRKNQSARGWKSRFARIFENTGRSDKTTQFFAHDKTHYTRLTDGSLRRKRLWAKGHLGKKQRQLYRWLRLRGHASRELALAQAVALR